MRLARRTLTEDDAEGRRRARIPMESVPHATAGLLRLGIDAQALEPAALVAHLTETVRAMAGLYPGG
ncbi:WYL domain-containing protein [Amycolatopsis speibonae]|uniref:WYL domain-containing protein n=1 Tax=Amycolatopsis speibonae TaxID=1450224 RepID=A0ABV7P461_9PSEU